MKQRLLGRTIAAVLALGIAACLLPGELAELVLPHEADSPSILLGAEHSGVNRKLTMNDPGGPRYLVFYPPGKAPSAELEFQPIPFESLLPPGSGGGEAESIEVDLEQE